MRRFRAPGSSRCPNGHRLRPVPPAGDAEPWLPRPSPRGGAVGGSPGLAAPFGVEDHPAEQSRRPAYYDVERDGHLLAIGDPGSGRSTLLRTLAGSLAARTSTGRRSPVWHRLWQRRPAAHRRAAAVRGGGHPPRARPGRPPADQVAGRGRPAASRCWPRAASPPSPTSGPRPPRATRLPYLVVLLDRWEGFNAEFETVDNGRLVSSFLHLMREGPGAGVRIVVTGDRSATSARFSSLARPHPDAALQRPGHVLRRRAQPPTPAGAHPDRPGLRSPHRRRGASGAARRRSLRARPRWRRCGTWPASGPSADALPETARSRSRSGTCPPMWT